MPLSLRGPRRAPPFVCLHPSASGAASLGSAAPVVPPATPLVLRWRLAQRGIGVTTATAVVLVVVGLMGPAALLCCRRDKLPSRSGR
jgi:hypothetical protein